MEQHARGQRAEGAAATGRSAPYDEYELSVRSATSLLDETRPPGVPHLFFPQFTLEKEEIRPYYYRSRSVSLLLPYY